jgi:DNA processing protein
VLVPTDADWPTPLAAMPLRPLVLFARGCVDALRTRPAVAVVGSRSPTPYGTDAARRLAGALVQSGAVLWSGLARGIDAIAHATCTEARRATVAVLAGGLDRTYPPEHATLAEQIVANGGCLLSELPPGRRARRGHFPRRNRLLAVGADAVVVVEASLASGALHTARFAAEHGTDVFALPGPWQSERSQGCHRLLAEGAHVVESEQGLVRDLGLCGDLAPATALRFAFSADAATILALLRAGPRPGDLLHRESGLDRAAFLRALFALVEQGAVARDPGDLWRCTTQGRS